jgi:hypothetical protein
MGRALRAAAVLLTALTLTLGVRGVASSALTPPLSTRLLSTSQFPKGWSVEDPSGSVQAGCLTNVFGLSRFLTAQGITQTSRAHVFVEDQQSVPMVAEMLATYTNVDVAYAKIVKSLASCTHVKGQVFGAAVTGTMAPKVFAHFTNESAAFSARTSILGTTFDEDILFARKGNVVVGIIEGGLAPVSTRQFQGFITKALARLA